MIEKATILIPDISGFTEFVTRTELDHSSHIINELLNIIIAENHSGFSLSEIEGDAVLFYKKGNVMSKRLLIKQCINMFSKFHEQLKYMERDAVCTCGACQTASNLSLKFIIHYGTIKEFRIANIVKASGVDMIIAHRLLKNSIKSDEYILISSSCCDILPDKGETAGLKWLTHTENYPAIGDIQLEYAGLADIRNTLPPVPERKSFKQHEGGDTMELVIEAPLEDVYQKLIDLDLVQDWMVGVTGVKRDIGVERIGTKHICVTPQMEMEVELDYAELREDNGIVVNKYFISSLNISGMSTDFLKKLDNNKTLLTETNIFNVPDEYRAEMQAVSSMSLELFKALCEGKGVNKSMLQNQV